MITERSCSWCHTINPDTERWCRNRGHAAHITRMWCDCDRCLAQFFNFENHHQGQGSPDITEDRTMKHTPGPWTVGQYTPTPHFLAIGNHSCVCDPGTMALIATCGPADDRQSQVDADLIAAAPDLLAACEAVKHWLEDETLNDLDELSEDCKALLGLVRAAIAKAKGATHV